MRAIHSPTRHRPQQRPAQQHPRQHHPSVVAADHPSLDRAVARFLADLRSERQSFATSVADDPVPQGGFRLAAVDHGRVVGLARVDRHGGLRLAVAADRRGHGIGTLLVRHAVDRARSRGIIARLSLRVPFQPGPDRQRRVTAS